ncbi:hypothetical protein G6F37_002029 [Rhizopus arrhizus]|nr:hypothetical protein G6F38_001815 [Rhizopus arrhizus]KAG1162561.1 hypothetical protein G6F37_002029 [Rhizopus arrhizus]
MDRLTQLQDAIDAMARMFTNSIYYVHEKSSMAELNKEIPVSQPKVQADDPQVFKENMHELVSDLVKKAKEIDSLIEVLPGIQQTEEEQIDILKALEEENKVVNSEYEEAVRDMADSSQSEQQTPESRSFVSSYSRASFRYMEENVGLPDHLTDDDNDDTISVYKGSYLPTNTNSESSPLLYPNLQKVNTNQTIDSYHARNKKSTFLQSIFNSINVLLGVGILALPLGFKCAGWFIGLLIFCFCFGLTNYSAKILIKCLSIHPDSKTYGDMGAYTFGTRGRVFISFIFLTELVTVSIALIVLLTDGIASLFPHYDLIWVRLTTFIILTPTLFIPVRHLSYTSLLGILSIISLLCIILYDGLTKPSTPGSLHDPADTTIFPEKWLEVPLSFGLIMSGFAGHAVFPSIYHDMQNQKEYKKMVNYSYLMVAVIYLTVAVSGYIMFGSKTMEEITQNILTVPEYNQLLNRFAVYLVALNPIAKYGLTLNPVVLTWQTYFQSKFICILLTTLTMVLLVWLIPNFDRVISLLGAFFSFFISGIFPLLCHIKLFRHTMSRWELALNLILLTVASLMAITGTIKSFF